MSELSYFDWSQTEFAVSSGPTLVENGRIALNPWAEGFSDPAVYRPGSGTWFILESSNGYSQAQYKGYAWGGDPDDVPVPGDYDGDGLTDPAVYRKSTGTWMILQSSNGYNMANYLAYVWGVAGDVPLKSLY